MVALKRYKPASEPMSAEPFVPQTRSLRVLASAVQKCRGCPLWRDTTQAVFGEGPARAKILMVGEQPGDQEDLQGHPFVGPAGRVLDDMFRRVGIPRDAVFLTNAVKHFKHTMRGKRRLHNKPDARETQACKPWLLAELDIVSPKMLVLMGSTAAQSLLGSKARVLAMHGKPFESDWCEWTMVTVHPSSVLRVPDRAARHKARADLEKDFRVLAKAYGALAAA